MQTDRDDIDKQLLLATISAEYGLALHTITFVPKGQEAYTYLAYADDGATYFVRLQPASKARELERVYRLLHQLRLDGLGEALAPIRTPTGRSAIGFGDELLAVFPYIKGETLWQRGATPADIEAAVGIIARLHGTPPAELLPREHFDNPFAQPIRRALHAAATNAAAWLPLQNAARSLLAEQQGDLLRSLELFEQLGQLARQQASGWVPTHGDPNRDNFLQDRSGALHLTDWGELALGPPERDLSFFTGDLFALALHRYLETRPHAQLHIDIFAFYAYRWSMQEIADYTTRLLFSELGQAENEHAWVELQDYLPIRHDAIAAGLAATHHVLRMKK